MSQIIIGLATEGTTDISLLESILQRTFVSVASECRTQIEVISPIIHIKKDYGLDFTSQTFNSSKKAFENGVMAFCVHVDADRNVDDDVFISKITPAFDFIIQSADLSICRNLIAVVPVQMSESWMLADKQLLKDEIGTEKTDEELEINRNPENFANPKLAIENAIRISRQNLVKRRRHELKISELYQPIGQKIKLEKLETLPSYMKFKEAVRDAYRQLKYLQ
jgi:hypothetical protein